MASSTEEMDLPPKPPSTPLAIPIPSQSTASRRRTPPLGRNLSKRSPPRYNRLLFPPSPPNQPSFTPTLSSTPKETDSDEDAFDLSEIGKALDGLLGEGSADKGRVQEDVFTETKGKQKEVLPSRKATGINDLPDELLLKILSQITDHYGFRTKLRGPRWYAPPVRIALVCKRWTPIARQLFLDGVQIHSQARVALLHRTLTTHKELSSLVRSLSIKIPSTASSSSIHATQSDATSSADEADSDLGTMSAATTISQLRTILHRCPNLIRLDLSGNISPSAILSSTTSTLLDNLHQHHFASITTLVLSSSGNRPLTASTLRGALLALVGLKQLSITGYISSARDPLHFKSGESSWRGRRTLALRRLFISESSFSSIDLVALFEHITPGSLQDLAVEEVHKSKAIRDLAARHNDDEESDSDNDDDHIPTDQEPTILVLPSIVHLVSPSLRTLRLSLFNYPLLTTPSPTTSSPLPPQSTNHNLNNFITSLPHLEILDLGGTVCSASLLTLTGLPPSVESLTLRGCTALSAPVVKTFLHSLIVEQRSFGLASPPPPSLPLNGSALAPERKPILLRRRKLDTLGGSAGGRATGTGTEWEQMHRLTSLEVLGGATTGWRNGLEAWGVQQACWEAGVKWRGRCGW